MPKKETKKEDQSQLVAILAYITIIGWIAALVINSSNKSDFGSFHIRQALLIFIVWFVLWFIPVIGWLLNIVVLVFWIMGLVYAIQKKKTLVPLFGTYAQDWFKAL
ncbi:hypothetical protein JXB02_01930 [Candidatus Woesearchaeota archaeon]|nr:hypothetical protein [Candidatus Woesearchaeota archaeon]